MNETILNWRAVKEIEKAGPSTIGRWRDKYGSPEEILGWVRRTPGEWYVPI